MEVIVNQWNGAENEVEEVSLQRKRGLKHSSSSSNSNSNSDKDIEIEGGGLDFDASKTKSKFEVNRTQVNVNAEMILQQEDIEKGTILPASDPPLLEDSHSLSNVTNESGTVIIIKENDQERQEFYLERVFQKTPTHEFYCPNCNACIQKVYIQKGEWEQKSAITTQPLQPTEPIRCSSCFSFLIPIGSWLFPGLVSEEDGTLNDQATGSSSNNRQPEGPKQTLKVASQHEAPEPDQLKEVARKGNNVGTSKSAVKTADDSGKHTLQNIEKVAREVEDKTNDTGLGSNPGNKEKSLDSSDHLSAATSQSTFLDQKKGQAAPKKKPFWSNWAVIGGSSQATIAKKPVTGSLKTSDWKVIASVSQATLSKKPEIDFPDKKQPELFEVKVDVTSTGPAEDLVPSETDRTPLLTPREPPAPASSKTLEIMKSIVYGGLTESLASLSVVTSAASADAATLNIVALAIANLIGGLFALGHNLRELKADQPRRANTDAQMDQYNELLGQRKNFILHAFMAILSFIVFGLVPPVVYGFSFRESDEKDFKLAAVVGASLLCISLLSIAKAYIKRPNSYLKYFQTVLYYVSTGAVASLLSYLAGDLGKKLMERLGWFETTSNFAMQIPGISVQQPRWGSF